MKLAIVIGNLNRGDDMPLQLSLYDVNVAVVVSFTGRLAWVRESQNATLSSC
jgi:hypothetical protein